MKKEDLGKTREFKCKKNEPFKKRKIGLFFTGFVLCLVVAAGAIGLMVVDYRGRSLAMGDAGSVFEVSSNDFSHRITVIGYDFYVEKSFTDSVKLHFDKTGQFFDKNIPLFVKITVNQRLMLPKAVIGTVINVMSVT